MDGKAASDRRSDAWAAPPTGRVQA